MNRVPIRQLTCVYAVAMKNNETYLLEEIRNTLNRLFEAKLVEEIIQIGKFEEVEAGELIMDYGQVMRHIPLILSGSVKVTRRDDEGRELLLYFVNALESCAMTFTCCMQYQQSEIRATAEENVTMIAVPVSKMEEWLVKYSTWKAFVMNTIQFRFNELLKTIDQIAFRKLDERLSVYLLERSQNSGSTVVNISHQQIADDLATSKVVVSRLLKKLENEEKLLLYRNQIKLLKSFFNPQDLPV